MSPRTLDGVTVTLYATSAAPVAAEVAVLVADTAFRLESVEQGPVDGTVTCRFVLREAHIAAGGGNLVDLLFRLQRHYELHGAQRMVPVTEGLAA